MVHRRLILSGLLASVATPLLAQAKSSTGKASDRPVRVAGRYGAVGQNPDGSSYAGSVEITQQGPAVKVVWRIGAETYRGVGDIEGRTITVDWGDTTPVIYEVQADGTLMGTWAGGAASEVLTPK